MECARNDPCPLMKRNMSYFAWMFIARYLMFMEVPKGHTIKHVKSYHPTTKDIRLISEQYTGCRRAMMMGVYYACIVKYIWAITFQSTSNPPWTFGTFGDGVLLIIINIQALHVLYYYTSLMYMNVYKHIITLQCNVTYQYSVNNLQI